MCIQKMTKLNLNIENQYMPMSITRTSRNHKLKIPWRRQM